jgi:hypothetical protein
MLIAFPAFASGEPPPAALAAFNAYIDALESRLAAQHRSPAGFLAPVAPERLRQGELVVEELTPATSANLPGAMLHHWRGSAFAPGATAADFERLMRDLNRYPRHFAPQVLAARAVALDGNRLQAWMRVRQHHGIDVTLDETYDIAFAQLDAAQGCIASRSRQIEIAGAGRHLLDGALWRLNTYWSYEERDGGLYLQVETVSLSRSIPGGLEWAVKPFVESIPRESLEFTLRSASNALRQSAQ